MRNVEQIQQMINYLAAYKRFKDNNLKLRGRTGGGGKGGGKGGGFGATSLTTFDLYYGSES